MSRTPLSGDLVVQVAFVCYHVFYFARHRLHFHHDGRGPTLDLWTTAVESRVVWAEQIMKDKGEALLGVQTLRNIVVASTLIVMGMAQVSWGPCGPHRKGSPAQHRQGSSQPILHATTAGAGPAAGHICDGLLHPAAAPLHLQRPHRPKQFRVAAAESGPVHSSAAAQPGHLRSSLPPCR